jgi:hypothetical protein
MPRHQRRGRLAAAASVAVRHIQRAGTAIGRRSIWHRDAIPITEGELARDVKRWVLPVVDVLFILASISGLVRGMPSFEVVYSETVSNVAAVLILAASIACLVGVSFPRLWRLELVGKMALAFVLLTYAALLVFLSVGGSARGFVAGVCAASVVLPLWRIVWLGREYRRRKVNA